MAFVNEEIPQEDKAAFNLDGIKTTMHQKHSLYMWTIDRERKIFLIRRGFDRDESGYESYAFGWGGEMVDVSVINELSNIGGVEHFTYDLKMISIPNQLQNCRESILLDLKEALVAFGRTYSYKPADTIHFNF